MKQKIDKAVLEEEMRQMHERLEEARANGYKVIDAHEQSWQLKGTILGYGAGLIANVAVQYHNPEFRDFAGTTKGLFFTIFSAGGVALVAGGIGKYLGRMRDRYECKKDIRERLEREAKR